MRVLTGLLAGSLSILLIGCSTGTVPDPTGTTRVVATGIHGVVHGGQQPVTGSTITLWSVGTSGYGSAGTSLATTTTDSTGSFNITGSYTCPASNPYVYITSTGGNPGLGGSVNNTAIYLMAALTDCNTLKTNAATTYIVINEATTVAATYALAQFMNTSTGAIGSYSYSNTGLQNAFSAVTNLVNTTTGNAYSVTPNGNGVVPQQEINTLADILAACVNTSSGSSTACASLFGDVQGSPGNTLIAALEIALHPGTNVAALYTLAGGTPPFQPTLSSAPNDWTVALSYNDGSSNPSALAIDGSGNVWVADFVTGCGSSRLAKLNPQGVPQSGSPYSLNLSGVAALAIDANENVWITNNCTGTLDEYGNGGNTLAGPFTGFTTPSGLAIDPNGNLWVTNNTGSQVSEFNTGNDSVVATYSTDISFPVAIAADSSGNIWVGNSTSVTELNNSGTPQGGSPYTSGGIASPRGIAIDGSNNVWIANNPGDVSELNSSGTALSGSGGYSGGGVGSANGIAIDGAGNVWIADRGLSQLSQLSSTGSAVTPSTGYRGGGLNAPKALAIDESGNVWVANLNSTTTGSVTTTISEFVGAGVPTIQPLVSAVAYGQVGQEPGTPIPVRIESGAVPYYTPAVAYSAQLYAGGGNSGTFTWSTTSTPPSGLSLSSGGLITGTTSVTGSTVINVKACDAANTSNCSSPQAFTLTANTTLTALGNESALTGSFAIQVQGYKNGSAAAKVYGADSVGSITFSGTGTVTGEVDSNNANKSASTNSAVTGYYTYGSDNRGTLVIVSSGGSGIELAFSGENFTGSTPHTLRLMEFDDTAVPGNGAAVGSGIAKLQTSAAFSSATLNQSFAFGLQGETPCNNDSGVNPSCATISPFGTLSAAGQFTGNNSGVITSGEEDAAGVNTSYSAISLSGSYTNPDSSGRGTLVLTPSGTTYPAAGSNFIYYIVNSGEMFLMSSDGHQSYSLLAGDALVQSGSFSNSTLSGNYVAYQQTGNNGDGVSVFPTQLDSSLIYISVQSSTQLSATIDENNGSGGLKLEQTQGPFTYSVASNGRMTIGSGAPVFYLASSAALFGTEQPASGDSAGLITGVQQTPGTFTCGPTSGNFAVNVPPTPFPVDYLNGVSTYGGILTLDFSSASGVLAQGLAGTLTCTSDGLTATTGRFVYNYTVPAFGASGQFAVYTVVPNSSYVLMPLDTNDTPQIFTVEK
jgi:hypothetical protein